mmetsp:Transcript_28134/g.80860  ORF Transcript_28134/g.80860 Transcript_28134/m.80860 type:complete len:209 (-) Transcript_28134:202-828(-)
MSRSCPTMWRRSPGASAAWRHAATSSSPRGASGPRTTTRPSPASQLRSTRTWSRTPASSRCSPAGSGEPPARSPLPPAKSGTPSRPPATRWPACLEEPSWSGWTTAAHGPSCPCGMYTSSPGSPRPSARCSSAPPGTVVSRAPGGASCVPCGWTPRRRTSCWPSAAPPKSPRRSRSAATRRRSLLGDGGSISFSRLSMPRRLRQRLQG